MQMREHDQIRLASVLTFLIGVFVALSPISLSISGSMMASVIITGLIMALAGLAQPFWKNSLPSWVSGLASVWLFISVFSFGGISAGAQWLLAVAAIVAFFIAFWDGVETLQAMQHHHHRL